MSGYDKYVTISLPFASSVPLGRLVSTSVFLLERLSQAATFRIVPLIEYERWLDAGGIYLCLGAVRSHAQAVGRGIWRDSGAFASSPSSGSAVHSLS